MAGMLLAGAPGLRAEDPQLRAQAIALMSHAHVVSTPQTRGKNVLTDATFQIVATEGVTSGAYHRLRGPGGLRVSIEATGYQASMIGVGMQEVNTGPWRQPPYPIKILRTLVPFSVGEFESKDVVRRIEPARINGVNALCVSSETIEGDTHENGELCFDQALGVMLRAIVGQRHWTYSQFQTIASAQMPGHIEYEEPGYSFHIDIEMKIAADLGAEAFAFPEGAPVRHLCQRFSEPLPLAVPPVASGLYQGPPETVLLRVTISREGAVQSSSVLRSPTAELGGLAIQTLAAWRYQPGTCDGAPMPYQFEVTVPFTGEQ